MPAGGNIKIDIYDVHNTTDDAVGGAVETETKLHSSISARLQPLKPQPLLIAQGIETRTLYRCFIKGNISAVEERDQIEVVSPLNHPLLSLRFQIIKIQRDSLSPYDTRAMTELTLQRYPKTSRVG